MARINKDLVSVEEHLGLGHVEVPDKELTEVLQRLTPEELRRHGPHIQRLIDLFPRSGRKSRDRVNLLLEKLDAAKNRLTDGGITLDGLTIQNPSTVGELISTDTSLSEEAPDSIEELKEVEDGRMGVWEIPKTMEELADNRPEARAVFKRQAELSWQVGDTLGAGEWAAAELSYSGGSETDGIFAQIVGNWASPRGTVLHFDSIQELIEQKSSFTPENLVFALAAATQRLKENHVLLPPRSRDLAYKFREELNELLNIEGDLKPQELRDRAGALFASERTALKECSETFVRCQIDNVKEASIEVVRRAKAFKAITPIAEKSLLDEMLFLLGSAFRSFCDEDLERRRAAAAGQSLKSRDAFHKSDHLAGIVALAPEIRTQAQQLVGRAREWRGSRLWHEVVEKVARRVIELTDDAEESTRKSTTPRLELFPKMFKLDLTRQGEEIVMVGTLRNQGPGRALEISMTGGNADYPVSIRLAEPSGPFRVSGNSEERVQLAVRVEKECDGVDIPIQWHCKTVSNRNEKKKEVVSLTQQLTQPNWEQLRQNPPYSLNPVRKRDRLFGRDQMLEKLQLHASARNSSFLWGQKRIGKTSILLVLTAELRKRKEVACAFLRVGDLIGLHEGQIAHRIAERFASQLDLSSDKIPKEAEFGAGMAKLIPWIEKIVEKDPNQHLVLIIDEFDDLEPSLYTGKRGDKFIKQLRSLSETGITFFLAGSERMGAIYHSHAITLNKWANVWLDSIESHADCQELVTRPLDGSIEFDKTGVEGIVDHCGKNPFYMQLLCYKIFEICLQERRTHIRGEDVDVAREVLVGELTEASFAHFWADNPIILDNDANDAYVAQAVKCALCLACISRCGGQSSQIKDLLVAQDELGLEGKYCMELTDLEVTVSLLKGRGVVNSDSAENLKITLEFLREWLSGGASSQLVAQWKSYIKQLPDEIDDSSQAAIVSKAPALRPLPISDEDLSTVSNEIFYQGKQVDGTKVGAWLRQFGDDSRVEVAFDLLKQLSNAGYVAEASYKFEADGLIDYLKERRQDIGKGMWKEGRRGRKDNLAITFVDGELKSGGNLVTRLKKRLAPGWAGGPKEPVGLDDWLWKQDANDAILWVVDDFAATGNSLKTGLQAMLKQHQDKLKPYLEEKRVLCSIMFALRDAMDSLEEEFPDIDFYCSNYLGDEVRAFGSEIFNEEDQPFAHEMLSTFGQELTPREPLGWDNMGLLVCFHDTIPNNTLPIFWSNGTVNGKAWKPLFPRPLS